MIVKLQNWLVENKIQYTQLEDVVFQIKDKIFLLLSYKEGKIFGKNTTLLISNDEISYLDRFSINGFIFLFGDRFYYVEDKDLNSVPAYNDIGEEVGQNVIVAKFYELRYIGDAVEENVSFPILGVHGGYDLCNGVGSYKAWVKKAKWLRVKTLGICEENTLAGTLLFQSACKKEGLKSIIGETIVIQHDSSFQYHVKLYVESMIGWHNLCEINAILNFTEKKSIKLSDLIKYKEGLIFVLTPTAPLSLIYKGFKTISKVFYQLDFAEWSNVVKTEEWLDNLLEYFQEYRDKIPPIAIFDSYYLERQDHVIQNTLWRIGKRENFKYRSSDRHFKTCDDYVEQALELFDVESEVVISMLQQAIDNAISFEKIDFSIKTSEKYLPAYELNEEQQTQFKSSEELFWFLIEKGMQEKVISRGLDEQVYRDRIKEEMRVIELGHVRDYFLIVWDILNFCKENHILTGIGRGCFTPNMRVKGEEGEKNIENIRIGDKVYNRFDELAEVECIFAYDVEEELIVIELENGKEISCTKDHKILTKRGYVAAQDLKYDDELEELFEGLK